VTSRLGFSRARARVMAVGQVACECTISSHRRRSIEGSRKRAGKQGGRKTRCRSLAGEGGEILAIEEGNIAQSGESAPARGSSSFATCNNNLYVIP